MKEFMLLVLNSGTSKNSLPADQQTEFVKKCEVYIHRLKRDGKLIAAQPLMKEGRIVSRSHGQWVESRISDNREVQVGYYHIVARDLVEAITIAKDNPEFDYSVTARIEVRPVKTTEERTGFVYPSK
jgi:hypothetical protein